MSDELYTAIASLILFFWAMGFVALAVVKAYVRGAK